GEIVQQGEPQYILLNPADPYIEDFVSDINRARVLRVRSVMEKTITEDDGYEILDGDETLERAILRSHGAADKFFAVHSDGVRVGTLNMTDVLKALVPTASTGRNHSNM
ncbi:glycine betaine/L-proline ABC transporter ATP-binding protein, partial [Mesorhizobium ciceri]